MIFGKDFTLVLILWYTQPLEVTRSAIHFLNLIIKSK